MFAYAMDGVVRCNGTLEALNLRGAWHHGVTGASGVCRKTNMKKFATKTHETNTKKE